MSNGDSQINCWTVVIIHRVQVEIAVCQRPTVQVQLVKELIDIHSSDLDVYYT